MPVGSEVLGITIYSHRQLEQLLVSSTPPTMLAVSSCWMAKHPTMSLPTAQSRQCLATPHPADGPVHVTLQRQRLIADQAKEVSQPDTSRRRSSFLAQSAGR